MIADWLVPFTLTTPEGDWEFNVATTSPFTSESYYLFLLDRNRCKAHPGPLRYNSDAIPQGDGNIIRTSFKPGYTIDLGFELWTEKGGARAVACDEDLQIMVDMVSLYAQSLLRPTVAELFGGECRLGWEPVGVDPRMFDHVRLSAWPDPAVDGQALTYAMQVATEFPYAITQEENTDPHIAWGDTETLVNGGTAPVYPTFRAYGPFSEATILNNTTGDYIVWFEGFPGAGAAITAPHYIEISTWGNTAYLDGSGANKKSGIDILNSDFFALAPGDNDIQFGAVDPSGTSTYLSVLYNDAWA